MKNKKINNEAIMLTISMGFLLVFIVFKFKWAVTTSLIVGVVGIASPFLSKWVALIWMKLTEILGLVVPNIILGLVFYLFIFPISMIKKIVSKKENKSPETNFITVTKSFKPEDLEHPW